MKSIVYEEKSTNSINTKSKGFVSTVKNLYYYKTLKNQQIRQIAYINCGDFVING